MTINLSSLDFWGLLENYTQQQNTELVNYENTEITMLYPLVFNQFYLQNKNNLLYCKAVDG